MGTVYSEDHTPADENHARSSDSPQYAAAVLPTVDQNQKNFKKKKTTIGGFMKQQGVMTTARLFSWYKIWQEYVLQSLHLHHLNAHLLFITYLYHASSTQLFMCKDHIIFPSRLCEINWNMEKHGID